MKRLVVVFVLLLLPGLLFGQANLGVVSGNVVDPSGAVVANATLTFISNATQFTRTTATDANGSYTMTALSTPFRPPRTGPPRVTPCRAA